MNDLALILLKGGIGVREAVLKGVFHRQFLPATSVSLLQKYEQFSKMYMILY